MAVKLETSIKRFVGDTADTKPVTSGTDIVPVGSTYLDRQTGILYVCYDGTNWAEIDKYAKLVAGTAIIGKVGIDQTTPGTTNAVTDAGAAVAGTETYTTSADMTTAAAIGPAPSAGQKSKLLELSISSNTAMLFTLQEETSATVRHAFRIPADGTVVRVFRYPSKLATADKKWFGKASVAGSVYITTTTVSEA